MPDAPIPQQKFDKWFQQFWTITGASTKEHPAPYPLELASRLVQIFSFTGDTVLDPFCGPATTMLAALKHGRNSLGVELDTDWESKNTWESHDVYIELRFMAE